MPTGTSIGSTQTSLPNAHPSLNALQWKASKVGRTRKKTNELSAKSKKVPSWTLAMASQKNPNTDPDEFASTLSNCFGGTWTGSGEWRASTSKGYAFAGPALSALGASEGFEAGGGVMNTVYLPAFPITGRGVDPRGRSAAMPGGRNCHKRSKKSS